MKRLALCILSLVCALPASIPADEVATPPHDRDAVLLSPGGDGSAKYQLHKPADVKLPVDSGGYFHPLTTPAGVVVTDVAPADHPHHRGVFLAWVEMHGKKDADFWGWGEHAPIKDRRIVSRGARGTTDDKGRLTNMTARNDWVAEGETVLSEALAAVVWTDGPAKATVLDLTYTLTPTSDLTLSRWAFSGFCVRTRGDGKLAAYAPAGEVKLPNPSHVKPESDWPAAPWYGYTLKFDDGKVAGVAVIDHPQNPPSLWHNHRDVRMLNPCIVAPAEVKLKANEPLVLRYRVVAHDGETPGAELNRLAKEWGKEVARQETRGQGDKGTR